MATQIFQMFGIENPIFAFTHCRDVVVAVSKAGGLGVLGAGLHSDERLEADLQWIDKQLGTIAYGVDLLMPSNYVGAERGGLDRKSLKALIPDEHKRFLDILLEEAGVPELVDNSGSTSKERGVRFSDKQARGIVDIALAHKPTFLVSALGTPPDWVTKAAHDHGRYVGALAGKRKHAEHHKAKGVDVIIAQSYEAGGHTGDIGGIVLIPEVVDAVAPTPVLAAGGIGSGRQMAAALALGAQGVWCGSLWLTTVESELDRNAREKLLAADTEDTVRSRSMTGKYVRCLRSKWTDAWDNVDAPGILETPLQNVLVADYVRRIDYAMKAPGITRESGAYQLYTYPVGQGIGAQNRIRSARDVVREMIEGYIDAVMGLEDQLGAEDLK
jgi:NAD(P)H-dependent flavin oxidoreductase YrpB (nitropropane dioxygenase family)